MNELDNGYIYVMGLQLSMETMFKFVFLILGYLHLRWYEGGGVFLPSNKGCIYVMGLKVSMEWLYQSFKDLERTLAELKLFFFRTLLDWMLAVGSHS